MFRTSNEFDNFELKTNPYFKLTGHCSKSSHILYLLGRLVPVSTKLTYTGWSTSSVIITVTLTSGPCGNMCTYSGSEYYRGIISSTFNIVQ